jgi:hypothetical protein
MGRENADKVGDCQVPISVEHFCMVWANNCANKKFLDDYANLTAGQKTVICNEAEERYIAYLIVLNSGCLELEAEDLSEGHN